MSRRTLAFGLLAASLLLVPARLRAQDAQGGADCDTSNGPYLEVNIDTHPRVNLELARTPQEQQVGLMFRDSLPADTGMLFVYQQQSDEGYWMYNTLIPLSIAWIDRDGTILDIKDMPRLNNPSDVQEASRNIHDPAAPYWYALEVNEGWFVEHGVGVGQQALICLGLGPGASSPSSGN